MPKIKTLERKRFSILTEDLQHCYICGRTKNHIHEIYEGSKRKASMEYGCCLPVCRACHQKFHNDREFALYYKKIFQKKFAKQYPNIDFISIFYKNYL